MKNLRKEAKMDIEQEIQALKDLVGAKSDNDLAYAAGVSVYAIAKWRKGKRIPPIVMEKIKKRQNATLKDDNTKGTRRVAVRFLGETYAAGGSGGAINYDVGEDALMFDVDFLRAHIKIKEFRGLHIITAIGNSMEPNITSGELLFVLPIANEGNTIKNGAIYVLIVDGETFVKRLERNPKTHTLTLKSDNKDYAPVTFEPDELEQCYIIGRVVGNFKLQ
jgi:phage repressor protein C with HTH and peptisase S24 domain